MTDLATLGSPGLSLIPTLHWGNDGVVSHPYVAGEQQGTPYPVPDLDSWRKMIQKDRSMSQLVI